METKDIIMWVVIAVLAVLVVYTVFFSGGSVDANTLASAGQAAKSSASSAMVGGC
ncbi:hypothetical protein ACFLZJ_01705 [Nanoarchaeota archaeon]